MSEKKPDAVNAQPDIDQQLDPEQEAAKLAEAKAKEVEVRDAVLKKLSKGTITLEVPLLARNEPVTELRYDFGLISGMEYIEAMDSDQTAQNAFKVSMKQAFALFAKGAAKCNPGLDEKDIRTRLSMPDVLASARIALVFFVTKLRVADERIKSE